MVLLKCGYWKLRGIMQPIRLLMEYLEVPYDERLYEHYQKEDGSWDRSDWFNEKFKLGLDFPNLPYMIDEETGVKLVQSNAILRYLCNKYRPELLGKTLNDKARVDILCGVMQDFKALIVRCVYGDFENTFHEVKEALKILIPQLTSYKKGQYFMGDYLTYMDFVIYEHIDTFCIMCPAEMKLPEAKPLIEFKTHIEALPKIAAYKKSNKFMERLFGGRERKFT